MRTDIEEDGLSSAVDLEILLDTLGPRRRTANSVCRLKVSFSRIAKVQLSVCGECAESVRRFERSLFGEHLNGKSLENDDEQRAVLI